MLRYLGPIAVCACIIASVGCDGPTDPGPIPKATLEFSGRLINADTEAPVGNVGVSVERYYIHGAGAARPTGAGPTPTNTATSTGDGTFTLSLNLKVGWRFLDLKLTGPPGYDDRSHTFEPTNAADRPAIRMYPTLVIRPGESIDVRVDGSIVWCGWGGYSCRRVLVAASPGGSVELEVVSHDSTKPMALGLANPANPYNLEPDMSVRRLVVPPGGVPYVIGEYPTGTATLTARR